MVKEPYPPELIIPYQPINLLTSRLSHIRIINMLEALSTLPHVDHIPYANNQKKKQGNGNVKSFVRLRREIQRDGLILAKHAEENALEKYNLNIGNGGRKAI